VQRGTRMCGLSAPQPVTFNHIKHTQQAVLSVIHWLVFDQWFVFEGVVTAETQLPVALVGFDQNVACFLTIATMTVNYLVVIATYRVIETNTIVLVSQIFFRFTPFQYGRIAVVTRVVLIYGVSQSEHN
jgi:hypothetical protein